MVKDLSGSNRSFRARFGGVAGVLTPVLAFMCIGIAIATYPEFNWFDNALSDLGVVPGVTSVVFNFGLVVSGLLGFCFAVGLFSWLNKNAIGKVGAAIFAAAILSLLGIGVANENIRPFHYLFSVAFFTLFPISLLVIAGYFLIAHQKRQAAFTFLVAVFAAAEWIVYFQFQYAQGVAIPELLSALAGAAWAVTVGWKMFKTGSQPKRS
jgi:hypothetical membrane protein